MKKFVLILVLAPLISFSQNTDRSKNYISIGFLDHKTGSSLVGYARSIVKNKNYDFFVGAGTLIAMNTLSIGIKRYLFHSFVDAYSVISVQNIYGMGGEGIIAPFISSGFEKVVFRKLFINVGVNSTIRWNSMNDIDFTTFPHINLNIRY